MIHFNLRHSHLGTSEIIIENDFLCEFVFVFVFISFSLSKELKNKNKIKIYLSEYAKSAHQLDSTPQNQYLIVSFASSARTVLI